MDIQIVKGKLQSNTFIVTKGETTIIIDAGADVDKIQEALGNKKPNAIILTHEHYDHIWCIADYAKTFDCPIYCHPSIIKWLQSGDLTYIFDSVEIPGSIGNFKPIQGDKEFTIGDFNIKPIPSPGHSIASIVFIVDDQAFTGDVLFKGTIGRTDLMVDGERLMQKSLKKLLDIKFETAHHGHGRSTSYDEQIANISKHIN